MTSIPPTDKYACELEWQKEWAPVFARPESQAKVLAYWKSHRFLDEVAALVGFSESMRVLDVGCGISTVLHFLPGERHGVDPLGEEYKTIYAYPPGVHVQGARGEALPFPAAHFDMAFCSNCIDHTDDPDQVLREVMRVVKPGGHFLLTCETFDEDVGQRNDAHPHSMTREKLEELVTPFELVKRWSSPWYGLQRLVLDLPPKGETELIFLLRRPA